MNRIFVAKKPLFISSNHYLNLLKRRFGEKKGGFSGILDPFACGALLVAFGQYTKLFRFLEKSPKVYQATLWLGMESDSLDLENVRKVQFVPKFSESEVESVLQSFVGIVSFVPPKYSAKKIQGTQAYKLARAGKEELLEQHLKEQTMLVDKIEFLGYSHPFISFRAWVSEGAYIRSLGALIARKLGCVGSLSYLERISEGGLSYQGERALNPLEILPFSKLDLRHHLFLRSLMQEGKKISPKMLKINEFGKYIVQFEDFFSIISYENQNLQYLVNRIPLC
ncbi:tRNA pseudouridine(55) synthase TruB [Helicobacter sp.]|uniref:tRNA pseudouridine(55) synthase TruB n=1 Tax=Helicobacter sp. TaxID=218 RepID=UPI0019AB328E|nr:tRNA pseudouridine(55) synthase TruB [Helicobacter sp.]MBD5165848.1 tRNA pseudouridine(55) synthase TruB [Helicobacter sp.]